MYMTQEFDAPTTAVTSTNHYNSNDHGGICQADPSTMYSTTKELSQSLLDITSSSSPWSITVDTIFNFLDDCNTANTKTTMVLG
jgi:hypothetical protein